MLITRKMPQQYMDVHECPETFQSDSFHTLLVKPHVARNNQAYV